MPPDMEAALAEPELEIWPDMADAVSLFFAMATQWRWCGGMAGAFRTGLDYGPLATIAGSIGVQITPEVLSDLRAMEAAAVAEWSRK